LQKYFHDVIAVALLPLVAGIFAYVTRILQTTIVQFFRTGVTGATQKKYRQGESQILAANVNLMEKMKSDYYDHKKTNLGSVVDRPK
jgi:hypothetical protein